jgi:hypothetical protein
LNQKIPEIRGNDALQQRVRCNNGGTSRRIG